MNAYTYPQQSQQLQHQQHQQQQSPTAPPQSGGINPAMLQGSHPQGMQGMQGLSQMQQAQLLARQQQMMGGMAGMGSMNAAGMSGMNMGGMNGMNNMGMGVGMPNGAMNMAAMRNNMGGMNMPGMGNIAAAGGMGAMGNMGMNNMSGMAGMNNMNMDLFKSNMANMAGGMGGAGSGMNMENTMTINPAMLGSTSNNAPMTPSTSAQDFQKMLAQRQAALNMGGMGGMSNMNMSSMGGMGGMGNMAGIAGMNMGMGMMGGNAQQQAMMQQYLAQQQQAQQHQQQQAQQQSSQTPGQAHSPPHSATQPLSSGGNPYPPFPSQAQQQPQQMQNQNASMPPPPHRPGTAMSTSSQHAMGMGIGRPPSTIHQQQQQHQAAAVAAMHNQQQVQQMGAHGSISRPTTAAGYRPSSSAGEAPRTPRTPQLANQQGQGIGGMQNVPQNQGQHVREASQTPSRPQTAASNHGTPGQPGMNGKFPMGMPGMGVGPGAMGGMAGMNSMNNMNSMGGMNLMGGAGGGMMPPPTLPRQGSLGPPSQGHTPMQQQPQGMQSQQHQHQQQMGHAQQQGMMGAHGHGSPMSASAPGSAGLTRTPSIGEGLGGMGGVMGGAAAAATGDDPMGNMSGMNSMNSMNPMNSGMGMGSGMPNTSMSATDVGVGMPGGLGMGTGGMGMGIGMGSAGGMGAAGGVGMSGAGGGGIGGGIGVGPSIGGMNQMQHMQEMAQRKAITLAEYQKQQVARQQQLQQQHQQHQHHQQGQLHPQAQGPQTPGGQTQSAVGPVGPSPGVAHTPISAGADVQNLNMAQAQAGQMPGMNMGMGTMGTPTRPSVPGAAGPGRGSMPPPGSATMSISGVAPIPGASSGVGVSSGAGAPPATASSGPSLTPSVNGAIPPSQTASANAAPTTAQNAQNPLAASLPPLPVQLNMTTTKITVLPISEAGKKIPQLSREEFENVAGWIKTDREYEQRYREMASRAKAEITKGMQRPRWWERDNSPAAQAAAAAARSRGRMEKFDLVYPHGQLREAAAAAARRKQRKREGLKVPGRLKPADAERGEQLVPIRLEFDVEHHKYRDTFIWNLNDPIVTPEAFAQSLIDDYGLSSSYHSIITKSIQEQLSDHKAHSATFADVSSDAELASNGEPKATPIHGSLEVNGEDAKWWASWRSKLRTQDGTVRKKSLLKEVAAAVAKAERSRKRKRTAKEHASTNVPAQSQTQNQSEAQPSESKEETKPAVTTSTTDANETPVANTDANPSSNKDATATTDVEMRDAEEEDMQEELRIIIKLDVTVGEMKLDDQFEWDLENPDPTPEQFAEVYCSDLGLAGEFKTAIAHSIREQVATYQKSLFLVGHPSDGSAIQDDDLRMSFLSPVLSAARSVDQTQAHQPIINYLSDGELDRLDKEREKEANKRRKRNTRGRRGITLPDREPIRTHRTPAIGFPEIDPSTLAIAAAAAAPTSRRAAAAAASLTIANMVASENGTALMPPMPTVPVTPVAPVSKVPKPRGSFKAPSYPSTILKPRANVTSPTPTTVVDSSVFEPPIEGDAPLPVSPSSIPPAAQSKVSQGPMTDKRRRELEKEAKEREFADGQRANMINGVWHCSNCGCPDSVAIGRRKGPLGDKSQCGACGKFWHRHRRPRPVEYHTDPEYHLNLRMESERAKASAKKRGGAAALRALNLQKEDQPATPATDEPSSPPVSKNEVWVEIKSPRKSARASPAVPDGLDLDRPLSPASDVSSSASEKPLARSAGRANGAASASKPGSTAATPARGASELPAQPEPSSSNAGPSRPNSAAPEPQSDPNAGSREASSEQASQQPRPVRPQWQETAMAELRGKYPDDTFDIILRRQNNGNPPEWRVKCLDCPGKLYTPGPGETLSNFEVHLKNRQHRAKVALRLSGGTNQ